MLGWQKVVDLDDIRLLNYSLAFPKAEIYKRDRDNVFISEFWRPEDFSRNF